MGAHDPRSAQDRSTVHNLCSPDDGDEVDERVLSQLEDEPEPDDVNMRLPSDKRLPACMGKMSSCLHLKNPCALITHKSLCIV